MTDNLRPSNSTPASVGGGKLLPIVVVAALPLAFGIWWWQAREPDIEDRPAPAQDGRPGETGVPNHGGAPNQVGAPNQEVDPWLNLNQTIFPMGVVETIRQTEHLTYLLIKFRDGSRWVATQHVELHPGDRVQVEVPPRALKENVKVEKLDMVFRKLVLVGADRVKLIKPADDEE